MKKAKDGLPFQPVVPQLYLFFRLCVLHSPLGEGPHLFKLLFLSVQHAAQVFNHLRVKHKKSFDS